jgi:type IV secretory pathway TraG/TraD family ATPase VirD4
MDAGLLLGRSGMVEGSPIGFTPSSPTADVLDEPIRYHGDGHLLTIISTGAGKTCGPVICNARTYPGQLIVLDLKGEAYRLSSEHRRRMGQKVHVIDLNDRSKNGTVNLSNSGWQ